MASYFEKYLDIAPFALALWRAIEAQALQQAKQRTHYRQPILDLGCGFGEFAGVFFNSTIEVGIDISATDLLRAAQGKKYQNLYVQDARHLSFPDNSFATVISISVLEHIPGVRPAIHEAYRVLRPGGFFIITLPTHKLYSYLFYTRLFEGIGLPWLARWYYRAYNKAFKHVNLWSQAKWEKLIRSVGFKFVYTQEIISPTVTKIFDLFLFTALPSQIGRWLLGNRLIWGLGWKKKLLTTIFGRLIHRSTPTGSNIILVAQKPA